MASSIRNSGWLAGVFALAGICSTASADTVIVYDASGSMWGQIEGEAKVTIARRVMSDLVRNWDEAEPLGLVAYGHRREGDCTDIETVVPPGPIDREALLAQIESISPKGKTPLTAAVRHAAEELKYRDVPASVILVSDGIESCNADPCAVASELAKAGINFTAHVVGFDVGDADQEQLACIAENTGGRFFAARDAAGLQAALDEASQAATEEVPEPEVTISAPESAVAGSNVEVSWQGEKIQPRDLVTIVPQDADSDAYGDYKRVEGNTSTVLLAPGEPGGYEARYVASATGQAVASTPIELTEPEVTVTAPETAAAGSSFTVEWTGAVHPRDYVTVVPLEAPEDAYDDYFRVGNGASDTLQAPAETGEYEVRYLLSAGDRVLARAPIEVVEKTVSVSAPESVTAGARFSVEWTDVVHPRDYVTVVKKDAPADAYDEYIRVGDGREGTLQAPAEPGEYQVRYLLQESGRAVASAPLQINAAETSVSAPESAVAGSTVSVSWTNTIHPRDYVTIVAVGAPGDAYDDYERVGGGNEAGLPVPAEPGDYEVRYVLSENGQALASAPLTVTEPETSVSGPEAAVAGSRISVSWTNVIHPRDYVTVVKADAPSDAYNEYERVGSGREASLEVPAEPGEYEVRYLLNKNDQPLAVAPLTVTAAETSVSGPETVVAGSRVTVEWTNTIHSRDKITIVAADAPADEDGDYERVGGGNSHTLDAPGTPGAYEIRYLLNVSGEAIARAPIELTAPEVTVSAPESVAAGSRFEVSWSNTVHPRDKVAIVPAGAPADADDEYTRAGGSTSGSLEAPESPGDYEVRYLLNASGSAIASTPIRVE
ncbi:MAG: VWA domain-containing protein [Xanthomonadales bacterium]|nr:VWA domain-containing protein [Xanthomonadales bacterium]